MRKHARDTDKGSSKRSAAQPNARSERAATRQAGQLTAARRAFLAPDSLTARDVQRLQNTYGNKAVTQLLKGATQRKASDPAASRGSVPTDSSRTGLPDTLRAGIENLSKVESFRGGEGVIQGVFIYNRAMGRFVDTETRRTYVIMGTVSYGFGRRAYQLQGDFGEYVEIDETTKERVSPGPPLPRSPTATAAATATSSSSPPPSPFSSFSASPFLTALPTPFSFAPKPSGVSLPEAKPLGTASASSSVDVGATPPTLPPPTEIVTADTAVSATPVPTAHVPPPPPTVVLSTETDERGTKRKRREEEPDDSEFEASDDDETTTLTAKEKVKVLSKKGVQKRARLLTKTIEKGAEGFAVHDPHRRKVYSAHRSSKKAGSISDINQQELVLIGPQALRIGEGAGYFIQPGGNKKKRPKKITEPPADYSGLFEGMKLLGSDPNSAALYKLATGNELAEKSSLSDAEVATIALYYMNNDAAVFHASLTRTQLTENLSKLTAITNISEFARALEATVGKEAIPYDATLLIKRGLQVVAEGTKTLREVFYQGTGGEESIFIGAPSQEHSPSGIGGAEVLRHPFKYEARLKRQMGIFPDRKKDFKAALNALKSRARIALPEMTDERRLALEASAKAEQVRVARRLVAAIKKIALPEKGHEVQDFLLDRAGPIMKFTGRIKTLEKNYAGNAEAEEVLKTARAELEKKRDAGSKIT